MGVTPQCGLVHINFSQHFFNSLQTLGRIEVWIMNLQAFTNNLLHRHAWRQG